MTTYTVTAAAAGPFVLRLGPGSSGEAGSTPTSPTTAVENQFALTDQAPTDTSDRAAGLPLAFVALAILVVVVVVVVRSRRARSAGP